MKTINHLASLLKFGHTVNDERGSGRTTALLYVAHLKLHERKSVLFLAHERLLPDTVRRYQELFPNERGPDFRINGSLSAHCGRNSYDVVLADEPWILKLSEEDVQYIYENTPFVAHTGRWRK